METMNKPPLSNKKKFYKVPDLSLRTILTSFLILVITFLVSVPFFIYHSIVVYLLLPLLSKRKFISQLTPYDSIFAVDEFHSAPSAANVTFLFLQGDQVSLKGLVREFETLTGREEFAKLRWNIGTFLGYYFWEDEGSFNVGNHVGELETPFLTESDLFSWISKHMKEPFQEGRPYWNVTLARVQDGRGVLVLRIHHCYADGYSQNFIVDRVLGVESSYRVRDVQRPWVERIRLGLLSPILLATLYRDALTTPTNFYSKRKVSTQGHIAMTSLNLTKLKQIRRQMQTHFATVGMSLLVGALRRHYYEQPRKDKSETPEHLGIMHSLPKPNHPRTRLVNHWGVGLFKVDFTEPDPLRRLLKAETNFSSYVGIGMDELLHWHMPILGWMPGPGLKAFFNINFNTSVGFTSVPAWEGRKDGTLGVGLFDGRVGGGEVVGMGKVFGFQWSQTAIASAVYTTCDTATITLYANSDIIPDQEGVERVVKRYLPLEFEALYKSVHESRVRRG